MTPYRACPRDEYGIVSAPLMTFEATNDLIAIAQAMQWADGCDLEVWHEGQRVGTVMRSKSPRCLPSLIGRPVSPPSR
jgi:hypothetical protein